MRPTSKADLESLRATMRALEARPRSTWSEADEDAYARAACYCACEGLRFDLPQVVGLATLGVLALAQLFLFLS